MTVGMSPNTGADQGALRVLASAMSAMVALALLFFLAPIAGLILLLIGILLVPAVMWVRARRMPARRPSADRTVDADTFR